MQKGLYNAMQTWLATMDNEKVVGDLKALTQAVAQGHGTPRLKSLAQFIANNLQDTTQTHPGISGESSRPPRPLREASGSPILPLFIDTQREPVCTCHTKASRKDES